jgi:hypothetical protein
MPYEPFYERFPDIAWKETRTLTTIGHPDLPDDEYGLIDAYCNDHNCDCRRVFLNVASAKRRESVAVIAYGWESRDFYVRWFGKDDPDIIQELKGPTLNTASRQSELAPALLGAVTVVLQDSNYVERLKRHYRMFKETVDGPAPRRAQKPPRKHKKKRRR